MDLFDHQHNALAYASPRRRIALFMEMRLGKTRVAIAWANARATQYALVVAPLTVLASWAEELEAVGEPPPLLLRKKKEIPTHTPAHKWTITNYEFVRAHPTLLSLPWDTLILDESSIIRNPKAQITRALGGGTITRYKKGPIVEQFGIETPTKIPVRLSFPGCKNIPNRAILSGLPAPEGPTDYFEQFNFLFGGFMGCKNYWRFRESYFIPDDLGWNWTMLPDAREILKNELRALAFILSRKEAGMDNVKVYETRRTEMSSSAWSLYEEAEETFALDWPAANIMKETDWLIVMRMWLARIAGGFVDEAVISEHKAREIMSLLLSELRQEKVVVWARFNAELKLLESHLNAFSIPHGKIIGSTKIPERTRLRHALGRGEIRVLLCQIKCAKWGIDLSAADTAIYYSNSYSLEERMQSEDRIVHPKKKVPLLFLDIISSGTVDEDVVKALRSKKFDAKYFLQHLAQNFMQRRKENKDARRKKTVSKVR